MAYCVQCEHLNDKRHKCEKFNTKLTYCKTSSKYLSYTTHEKCDKCLHLPNEEKE